MKSNGFTLIELVVVIVILGILAATAAPKFIDLTSEAKTATLQGVKASIEGASALIHSKAIVKGNQKLATSTLSLPDGDIDIAYGYPIVPGPFDAIPPDVYWKRLISTNDDYVIRAATDGKLIVYPSGGGSIISSSADCLVSYAPPADANARPKITVNDCI